MDSSHISYSIKTAALLIVVCFLCIAAPGTGQGTEQSFNGDSGNIETVESSSTDSAGIFETFTRRLQQTWNSDSYDLYVPLYAWHNRLLYDRSRARKYNENAWGGGLGKSFKDEDGDRHYLFLMGFQDSHDMFQPYGGYAFMKNKYLDEKEDLSVGAGIVAGITARQEYEYIPFPFPLPIVGVQYKRLAVEAAYIPGGKNGGNVLFTWIRLNFE